MNDTYGRYIFILPVVEMRLDLLPFGKRHTWLRSWEGLEELNGKIIGKQLKIFTYTEDAKHKPSKLFLCTLVDALREEEAYDLGRRKVEEFVYLMSVFLRKGFRILPYETVTVPLLNVRSIKEVELQVDKGYVTKIIAPRGRWTILSPHFGEITGKDIFPSYFEMPKIEGKVSHTAIAMSKTGLYEVGDFFVRIKGLKDEERGLLNVIGQLYSAATTSESVSTSYLLLWETLEVYSHTLSSPTRLLNKETLIRVKALLKKENYQERDVDRLISVLGMYGEKTETEVMSFTIHKNLFPKKRLSEIHKLIRELRKTRSLITHPKILSDIDKATLLDNYAKLREIVENLLLSYIRRYGNNKETLT